MVMVFSATFNNVSSWGVSFHGLGNQSTWRKTPTRHTSLTKCPIKLYQAHLVRAEFALTTLVLIGIDCMVSCKYSYYTIRTV
jgi:hypothetical protein